MTTLTLNLDDSRTEEAFSETASHPDGKRRFYLTVRIKPENYFWLKEHNLSMDDAIEKAKESK